MTKQEEPPLSSISSHAVFPGRSALYVAEVAAALCLSQRQVIELIDQGELPAIKIASATLRKYWRVPVSGYDAFIAKRAKNFNGSPQAK